MLRSMILYDTRRPSLMAKQYDNLDDNGDHGDKDDRRCGSSDNSIKLSLQNHCLSWLDGSNSTPLSSDAEHSGHRLQSHSSTSRFIRSFRNERRRFFVFDQAFTDDDLHSNTTVKTSSHRCKKDEPPFMQRHPA